jgi:hypothetical protein
MTPGIATRAPTPVIPSIPQKSKARHSLPSTPSRRQSLEMMGVGMLSIPKPSFTSDSTPRVVTPCESDYRQTGAFKLGSLRITNGSPVRSPAVEHAFSKENVPSSTAERGYFPRKEVTTMPNVVTTGLNMVKTEFNVQRNLHLSPLSTSFQSQSSNSGSSMSSPRRIDLPTNSRLFPDYLPEIHLSPLAMETSAPELQTTSKHTAMEDDLFDDEQQEFSYVEVLDVRVDLNAKSLPPRPRLISEGRNARDMTRSDSGVVATPISEYSHKSLAKTDSGYSSNVSLRSFSAKPPIPEKDQSWTSESEVPPSTPAKDNFPPEAVLFPSPRQTESQAVVAESQEEVLPPPVPEKDHLVSPVKASKEVSPAIRQNSRLDQIKASIRTKSLPSPINSTSQANGPHGASKSSPRSPLSPTSSTTSTSALSISSDSRRPGKLQRFLSGARIPLTTHTTHPSEKNGIPPIPLETEAKLHEHSGQFPLSVMKFGLKAQLSKETLGTIFSVGSAEATHDEDIPPVPSLPKIVALATEDLDESQAYHGVNLASVRSTSSQAATAIVPTRKPILRKPVPMRSPTQKSKLGPDSVQKDAEMQTRGLDSTHNRVGEANLGAAFLAMADERDMYFAPTKTAPRTQTMTAQVERDLEMHYAAFGPNVNSSNDYQSTVLEPTLAASRLKKTKTPPPVSMRTRNSGFLRVPPPLRAQSTPPDATRVHSGFPLSRKTSRESIHSYPAAVDPRTQPTLSRRSSRDNVRSYPPAQEQYEDMQRAMATPPEDLRRSLSFVTNSGEHRRPNWEVQTDHGSSSRRTSVDHSRRNSVTSQQSQQSHGMPRPRPHPQFSNPAPPQLRHRSSYDGYSRRHVEVEVDVEDLSQSLIRDNGPYPSMPAANGHAYVSDPWSGRPMPQQFDQQGRYPPYVPRGHTRNRSVGVPYRVLHSYNSPAYKNVPIWG